MMEYVKKTVSFFYQGNPKRRSIELVLLLRVLIPIIFFHISDNYEKIDHAHCIVDSGRYNTSYLAKLSCFTNEKCYKINLF